MLAENFGPNVPATPALSAYAARVASDVAALAYLPNNEQIAKQMVAAGYGPEMTMKRAMQDAFSCLFI